MASKVLAQMKLQHVPVAIRFTRSRQVRSDTVPNRVHAGLTRASQIAHERSAFLPSFREYMTKRLPLVLYTINMM